jgi:GntR family transcriptional regulator
MGNPMRAKMPGELIVSDKDLGFRPLYRQVRDLLVRRIADGIWQAGQPLPSESEIALDLGVSQGTVRKALDEMTSDNLVVRRQGRGTYVARHDDARILFQFFKLVPDTGERSFPESRMLETVIGAYPEAATILGLKVREQVLRLDRVRSIGGDACILERIYLPASLFRGLETRPLPNNLYEFYALEYGVTIGRASEKLKAVAATDREAKTLGTSIGSPLLRVDRVAYALDGRRVEWRVSLCSTEKIHYWSDLR